MKGLARDRKKVDHKPVKCRKCQAAGGTLVKIDDEYEHQDKASCTVMQLRKK